MDIDKLFEEIDQKQAEMEELGLINYGDSGYYIRNPEEYEKDSKICELESKIARLEYLLEISEKALELACETANYWWKGCIENKGTTSKDYNANEFLSMAKEKMKSE